MRAGTFLAVYLGVFWIPCALLSPIQAQDADRKITVAGKDANLSKAGAEVPGAEHNWGIFIGINKFDDEQVNPLRYCVADAESLRKALTGPALLIPESQSYLLVTGAKDKSRPTRRNIIETLTFVTQRAVADSLIFLSISTHGFATEDGKTAYILPEDGSLLTPEDLSIAVERINDILKSSKASKRIVIVDACRIQLKRGERAAAGLGMSDAFKRSFDAAMGQVTFASCGVGEVAHEDPDLGHGVFSRFMLEGLRGGAPRNGDGFISVLSLTDYTTRKTREWCNTNRKSLQNPYFRSDLSGDIPLAIPGAYPPLPTPAPTPVLAPAPTPASAPQDYIGVILSKGGKGSSDLDSAIRLYQAGQFTDADYRLRRAYEKDAENADILILWCDTLLRRKEPEKADAKLVILRRAYLDCTKQQQEAIDRLAEKMKTGK